MGSQVISLKMLRLQTLQRSAARQTVDPSPIVVFFFFFALEFLSREDQSVLAALFNIHRHNPPFSTQWGNWKQIAYGTDKLRHPAWVLCLLAGRFQSKNKKPKEQWLQSSLKEFNSWIVCLRCLSLTSWTSQSGERSNNVYSNYGKTSTSFKYSRFGRLSTHMKQKKKLENPQTWQPKAPESMAVHPTCGLVYATKTLWLMLRKDGGFG